MVAALQRTDVGGQRGGGGEGGVVLGVGDDQHVGGGRAGDEVDCGVGDPGEGDFEVAAVGEPIGESGDRRTQVVGVIRCGHGSFACRMGTLVGTS